MTLSFAFSQIYHRPNRAAKRDGPHLLSTQLDAGAQTAELAGFRAIAPNRAGSCRICGSRGCSLRRHDHYNAPAQYQARKRAFMQQQPPAAEFGIAEARRVLGEVFAPWVMDLNLSIERFDFAPSGDAADWQPGAILRLPFSERLCRNGGTVSGQALMAFADTAMVIANLAANRGYRPMTTVDQTTHFMRAVSASDVLADARVVRLGRTMSFGRVTLLGATDNKPVAMVSSAFAML
jgi:uncharacterized protein (TIGR00369 family)